MRADDMDVDLMEITAHSGARPEHAAWQGKEAKLKDFCEQTGLNRDKFREQVFSTTTENGLKDFGKSVSQKSVHAAKQRYKDFVSVVGAENAPETLDKYYELKYNKPKEFDELKRFYKFRMNNPTSTKQHFYCVEDVKKVVKCQKAYLPSKEINVDELFFDDKHVNIDKNHNVTELEAKLYIKNSKLTLERYNGNCWIFISKEGASYVLREENKLRTAFDVGDYKGDMEKIVEELNKHGFF